MKSFLHLHLKLLLLVLLPILSSCKITGKLNQLNYIRNDSILEDRKYTLHNNDKHELELVLLEPTNDDISIFEKVELGILMPIEINDLAEQFLNNSTKTYLNPYDPDHINIEATFIQNTDTFKTFGFYYKEYNRDLKANDKWKDVRTPYNWRIRFAPPSAGNWTCNVQINFPNSTLPVLFKNNFEFTCIDKNKKGFIEVADDHRHFRYSDSKDPFIPIAQNIPWTDEPIFKGNWLNANTSEFNPPNKEFKNRLFKIGFLDMNGFVENAADNKGNMIRVVSWHNSYLFEWEERGVYGSNRSPGDQNFLRQKRAWELDQLFETAELKDLKLLFCLEFQGQYCYDWNGGDATSFNFSPYNKVEIDSGKFEGKLPTDFFSNADMINAYKKKLRYFIARWGYSPSLGILQLLSEFDGWGIDSVQHNKKMHSIINTDAQLQKNIRTWHDEMGGYLHSKSYRPMIVTSGFMTNTKPFEIPKSRNFYDSPSVDMVIWNRYGNGPSINFEMYNFAQRILNEFEKPYLYTETGIITSAEKNADPGDLEGCDDVMFHNFSWAGSVMGCAGTSMEWWQAFDNKRRGNFKALDAFYQTIDFRTNDYTENNRWNDRGSALYLCGNIQRLLNKKSLIEVYYVSTKKKANENKQAFGWAHNLTSTWSNLPSYMKCPDRNNHVPYIKDCMDDAYEELVNLNSTDYPIKLKGLSPNTTYEIQWYQTRGEGGLISTQTVRTNIFGGITFLWPGTDFDYAFKLNPSINLSHVK